MGTGCACTLSRDGNAEIYLISRDAQTARRLTRNERIDSSPSFSPTGREIVFTSDRSGSPQIYVMDSEGSNQRLLTLEGKSQRLAPVVAERGQDRLRLRHDAVFDVIVMDSNGQNSVQVTYDAGHNENPRWSADGRKIYFSSSRLGKRQIFMMNTDGSDVVQLTQGRIRSIRRSGRDPGSRPPRPLRVDLFRPIVVGWEKPEVIVAQRTEPKWRYLPCADRQALRRSRSRPFWP